MNKKLIALPSLSDLEREAERNNRLSRMERSRVAYMRAQRAVEQAHLQMAYVALSIVRPHDWEMIDRARRSAVYEANRAAKMAAADHFTEECLGFRSEAFN